jgi:hypothetical protein
MTSILYPNEILIDDNYVKKNKDALLLPKVGKRKFATGYDPSTVDERVRGMLAKPSEIKLIDRSEWPDRIKEKEARKSRISDVLRRKKIPSTDQNSDGYCWFYSTTGCVISVRALNNQPYKKLNGHSGASIIKNGRNEGGWCGLSAKFVMENGIAVMGNGPGEWPEHSRNTKYNTAECQAAMKKNRVTEAFIDLSRAAYDQQMTFDQVATCLLLNIPCAGDFNWWGHSVLLCDLVDLGGGHYAIRFRNSWTDSYGDLGFSVLAESKTRPDNAVGLATVTGSADHVAHVPALSSLVV